jgi:hypothetical protein
MAILRNLFRKTPTPDAAHKERVRVMAEAILGPDGLALTISEVECADPTCPGLETILLVMRDNEPTQAVKIRKPIAEIQDVDLKKALHSL